MANDAVKHDYHIINPSPWPLLGSLFATVMFLGVVVWMKGLGFGQLDKSPVLFGIGLLGVLYVMFGWWRDVIKESKAGDHTPVVQIGLRYGMIMFIASEVMFFVAFFWIFFEAVLFHEHRAGIHSAIEEVRNSWTTWPPKGIEAVSAWQLPLVNTLLLLLSGTTVTWAHHALQQGDREGTKWGLILTVILGVVFTAVQAAEYHHILHHHLFFNEEAANSTLYGSAFFMATGFHGFHVLIGTIFLFVCLLRLLAGGFTPQKHFGFEAAAWYWHFVDVVWLFLFAFIYVIFGAH
ncbi:cytochrome c oxidase subunit 3 [Asticcacaulis sp. BYS171W]|uniref:cytochrome-c oxidase n=1 Tax=Asticcacaulis aquaticus TaxID=2984212 RepID=A0ABT5HYS7_9CAUL|nr:cytochrome c oxidase subunit 3 [Asticcacaulis aquaticus]MDC7685213.1 cytochrome c oxidase subunit 3 [Asticcacaulis aquaticus]